MCLGVITAPIPLHILVRVSACLEHVWHCGLLGLIWKKGARDGCAEKERKGVWGEAGVRQTGRRREAGGEGEKRGGERRTASAREREREGA